MQPGFTQGISVGFLLDVLLKAGVLDATDVSFAGFQSAPELTIVFQQVPHLYRIHLFTHPFKTSNHYCGLIFATF